MNMEEAIVTAKAIDRGAQDVVVPLNKVEVCAPLQQTIEIEVEGERMPLSPTAQTQMAQLCGIPTRYWAKCANSSSASAQLLAEHANHWLAERGEQHMVRTVDPVTDLAKFRFGSNRFVRAIVSDRYLPFSNSELLGNLSDAPDASQWRLEVDEERLSYGMVNPDLVGKVDNPKLNDIVQGGVSLRNSEVGDGVLSVALSIFRLVCLNGMIAPVDLFGYRRRHIGKRVENAEQHDASTVIAATHTILESVEAGDAFGQFMDRVNASTQKVMHKNWISKLARNKASVSKSEQAQIEENFVRDGDTSLWGAVNAITYTAHTASTRRSDDLHLIGGKVLTSPGDLVTTPDSEFAWA